MGIPGKSTYEALDGFSPMRFGEDIDFSIRLFKNGYKVCLFPSAWVYHKRRTDWHKFFRQVYNSGIARINLYKKYPDSLKLVHLLPAAFTLGVLFFLVGSLFCTWSLLPLGLFCLLIFADSSIQNKSIKIGFLSIIASFIQLSGYGCGIFRCCLEQAGFEKGRVFGIPKDVLQIKRLPKVIVKTTVFIPYEH